MSTKAERLKQESRLRLTAAETLEMLEQLRPDFHWTVNSFSLERGRLEFGGRTTGETADGWVGYELSFSVKANQTADEFVVSCLLRADEVKEYGWGSGDVEGADLAALLDEAEDKLWEDEGDRISKRLAEFQRCIDVFHELVDEKTK